MIERFWHYNPKTNSYKASEDEPLSVFPTVVKIEKKRTACFLSSSSFLGTNCGF